MATSDKPDLPLMSDPGSAPLPSQQQPPADKRRVWPWVLLGVLLGAIPVGFLGLAAYVSSDGRVANQIAEEAARVVTVTYEVSGSANSVAVTYWGPDFRAVQETRVSLPWRKEVGIDGLFKTVSLTATNRRNNGTVTCRIIVNNKVIAEETANGPRGTAKCVGRAGDA